MNFHRMAGPKGFRGIFQIKWGSDHGGGGEQKGARRTEREGERETERRT